MTSSLSIVKEWAMKNKRLAVELFLGVLTALSIAGGAMLYHDNKTLSDRLEMANNNIEAYQTIATDAKNANNVLVLQAEDLKNSNDLLIHKLDSVKKLNKIKDKELKTAATQTQSIIVNKSKEISKYIEVLKDTIYTDSILYNNLTKVYYTIGNDSINIGLDIKNTQYLYTYKTREYKNKKNFIKRLFTLDFKKVDKYKYKIVNTNDLLNESDIRIIEQQ